MCIAFGLDDGRREQVVVVVELPRELMRGDHQRIIDQIRARVATDHEVAPDVVVLVRTTTLPRTSSGKVQRRRCRLDYQQQQLDVVAQWQAHAPDDPAAASGSPSTLAAPTQDALRAWLVEQVAALTHRAPATVDAQAPLSQFGFDSVQTVALAGALQQRLGRELPATIAYDYPTIDALASHLTGATARTAALAGGSTAGRTARSDDDAIAIVGLACRMPGADSPEAFWSLLERGEHAITAPPADRDPALGLGGYLADVSRFDAACFGISPHEAGLMDPQQRLLCEVTWEALERAGMVPSSLGTFQSSEIRPLASIAFGSMSVRAVARLAGSVPFCTFSTPWFWSPVRSPKKHHSPCMLGRPTLGSFSSGSSVEAMRARQGSASSVERVRSICAVVQSATAGESFSSASSQRHSSVKVSPCSVSMTGAGAESAANARTAVRSAVSIAPRYR